MNLLLKSSSFLLLSLFFGLYSSAQLRLIHSEPGDPENEVVKMSFYSPSEGFVAFKKSIGYTTDSGRTFIQKTIRLNNVDYGSYPVNLTFGFGISSIKAFDRNNIIVSGDYGLVPAILSSSDGGNSFKVVYHSQYDPMKITGGISDMIFPAGNTGYAVDADRILKSIDGGQHWTPIFIRPGSYFTNIVSADNQNVFAFSTEFGIPSLFKTTNGGDTWVSVNLPPIPEKQVMYVHFRTAAKGWLCMKDNDNHFLTYGTNDGGSHWEPLTDVEATPMAFQKLHFVTDNIGYALGGIFYVFKTTDGGRIWEPLPRDNQFSYLLYGHNDLFCWNEQQFWAGGGGGLLEISTNGGGNTLPRAYFKADTSQISTSGQVQLKNYSKSGYTYQWIVNGKMVSTDFHSAYPHEPTIARDTLKLVVSNGTHSDTTVKYYEFATPLEIISFAPLRAASGTIVTITGKEFYDVTSVSFGGVPVTEFYLISPTTIQARVSTGASGVVRVYTTTRSGSLPGFNYIPPPVISSFLPTSATAGTTVTIRGTNLDSIRSIKLGGIEATSIIPVSSTEIKVVVPSGSSGNLTIVTEGGTFSLGGYIALPEFNTFTPAQGTQGTVMTITGTSLLDVNSIMIGGVPVQSFTANSAEKITAIVSTGASGNVVISKTGANASKSGFAWFPAPVITSFLPQSGPVDTIISINGRNFDPVANRNIVFFGDVKAEIYSATSTKLMVRVPYGASYQPITVISNQLVAYSAKPFHVTFTPGGSITKNSFSDSVILNTGDHYNNYDLVSRDLDNDGLTDLILSRYNRDGIPFSGVAVYRNKTSAGVVSFETALELSSGWEELKVTDLDNDGKQDILVKGGEGLLIYRNTSVPGTLSFASATSLPAGSNSIGITDADSDGKTDIVVLGSPFSGVNVLRNISEPGMMVFSPGVQVYPEGWGYISTTDLNGDGKYEIITNGQILQNKSTIGQLLFEKAASWPSYDFSPQVLGDIDGDGKQDIITYDHLWSVIAVVKNISTAGNISFGERITFQSPELPRAIDISDMDGDRKLDIVVSSYDHRASIFKNTSYGGNIFLAPKTDFFPGSYRGERGQVIADINKDGKNDLVTCSELTGELYIHLNNVKPAPFVLSFTPAIAAAGDTVTITGNNFTGITNVRFGGVAASSYQVKSTTSIIAVVAGGSSGNLEVTNNFGTGFIPGFSFGIPPQITAFAPAHAVAGALVTISGKNFNANPTENIVYFGISKAAVQSATATTLTVIVPQSPANSRISVTANGLTAYSRGYFSVLYPGATERIAVSSFEPRQDRSAGAHGILTDLDGDGKPDLVMNGSNKNINIAKNLSEPGKIQFAANSVLDLGISVIQQGLGSGDFDGDGKQDLVTCHPEGTGVSILRNFSVSGIIDLQKQWSYTAGSYYGGSRPMVIDLDADGKPELITISYSNRSISVYRNESVVGMIRMSERIAFPTESYPNDLKVTDIDGDGRPELIVAADGLAILRNTSTPGKISFVSEPVIGAGNWPSGVDVGDLDGDGKPDIAIANINSANISLYRNLSTGGQISFAGKMDIPTGEGPFGICIGDLDGDGKVDLNAQAIYSGSIFSVHKNLSSPGQLNFSAKTDFLQANGANQSIIADIDLDGLPDIAGFGPGQSTSLWRNRTGLSEAVRYCNNGEKTLVAEVVGSSYQWQVNKGTDFENLSNDINYTGTGTKNLVISKIPANWQGYLYRCMVDGTADKVYLLDSLGTMVSPEVKIFSADSVICAGTEIELVAQPQHGGAHPKLEWLVNGVLTGISSDTLRTATLTDQSEIRIRMISDAVCVTTDTVVSPIRKITVNSYVSPTVSITASSTEICNTEWIQFNASYTNGGSAPFFHWRVNGRGVVGEHTRYTDHVWRDGDIITVEIRSNAACLVTSQVVSNEIKLNVHQTVTPEVHISSNNNTLILGQSAIVSADTLYGGHNPVFEWQDSTTLHSWQSISGANGKTISYMPESNGVQLRLRMTSVAICPEPAVVISNAIVFDVKDPGKRVQVTPNPVEGTLYLVVALEDHWEKLDILDMQGKPQIASVNVVNQAKISVPVMNLKPGIYIAVLRNSAGEQQQIKFLKQ